MNFEEILKDPKHQAAFDRKVAMAIGTAKKKWLEEAAKERKEFEENAKLTASQRTQKELENLKKENEELKASEAKRLMKDSALEYIKTKGYSNAIGDLVDLSSFVDEDDMHTRLDSINTNLSNTVSRELDNKLKENGYPDIANKESGKKDSGFDFNFTKIKE